MKDISLGTIEAKFADYIWENEPIPSGELVKYGEEKFGWKKPTTYTVIRRLCAKGLFKNEDTIVSSLMSKDDYIALRSKNFVGENFGGSLPAFFAAFTSKTKLSEAEIEELRRLIDNSGESK